MSTSPTQLALKYFRDLGYEAQVAEYWNAYARRRTDLFGFIDIVAIRDGEILGIQATSAGNRSARRKKIYSLPTARNWLRAGGKIVLSTWKKSPETRGSKKLIWKGIHEEIMLESTYNELTKKDS